jgi:ABC transport system ATP-binding/permease protein
LAREESGEWRIIDLQSANGVKVNGEKYAQVALKSGDLIELGHLKLTFLGAEVSEADAALALKSFDDVGEADSVKSQKDTDASIDELGAVASPWPKRLLLGGLGLSVIALAAFWFAGRGEGDSRITDETLAVSPTKKPATGPSGSKADGNCLSEGRALIESLEWTKARTVLVDCRIGSTQPPEARALVERLDAEKAMLETFKSAEAALKNDRPESAQNALREIADSELLASNRAQLEARVSAVLTKRMQKNERAAENGETGVVKKPVVDEGAIDEKLLAEDLVRRATPHAERGTKAVNANKWSEGADAFTKCLQINPKAPACLGGMARALTGLSTKNGPESTEKARLGCGYYKLYASVTTASEKRNTALQFIKEFEEGPNGQGVADPCPIPTKVP